MADISEFFLFRVNTLSGVSRACFICSFFFLNLNLPGTKWNAHREKNIGMRYFLQIYNLNLALYLFIYLFSV